MKVRTRLAVCGVLALALSVTVGLGSAQAKKKAAKIGGTIDVTTAANAPIPNGGANFNGLLTSSTTVGGKKFKGTRIRDVNVTVQTTGSAANAAGDIAARLTAPDGTTTWLFAFLSGQSIGPLTLDDQSVNILGQSPPAPDSTTLVAPYAGSAQPATFFNFGPTAMSELNNGVASGTWTLRVYDLAGGTTSILNSWRLVAIAGRPYKTK